MKKLFMKLCGLVRGNNDTICPNCKDLWDFTDKTGSSICGNCNFNNEYYHSTEVK